MKIFVDASVFLAAAASKSGGSALVLQLGKAKRLQLVTSQTVMEEVVRNAPKLHVSQEVIDTYIVASNTVIVPAPRDEEVEKHVLIIGEKDAHVVAAAFASKSHVIVTLDKKHLLSEKVKSQLRGLRLVNPEELLRKVVK